MSLIDTVLGRSRHVRHAVVDCHVCPFWTYTGGIHECRAPFKWRPDHDKCETAAEKGKLPRQCPLRYASVVVCADGERV